MKIRMANAGHITALNRLVNGAYRGEGSKKGWTTEADLLDGIRTSENSLRQMIERPNAVILLVEEENNELQACVYLEKQAESLYLGMLTVRPDLQGNGLGAALMLAAEAQAKKLKCSKIQMTVIAVREELINYYKRKGFVETGDRKPFPNDPAFGMPKRPLEFLVMEKFLQ